MAEACTAATDTEAIEARSEAAGDGRGGGQGPHGSPRRHNTQCHNVRSSNSVCPNHSTTAPHVDGRHRGTRAYKHIRYSPSLLDTSLSS